VSVIVPARNAERTLGRTLRCLAAQEFDGGYEVIVVDDGSVDRTVAVARDSGGWVVEQPPSGPAAARNLGVGYASGEIFAFCDADVYPTPGWLAAGVAALQRADVVQGKVLPDPEATLGPFDRTIWITFEVGLFETANLFVRRELFDRVGGFEEWIRPREGKALAEDMWFGYRALRLGARSGFSADALAYHAVFERGWRGYVRERARLEYFPAMARQMPELRESFLHRRWFLNSRSARLDLAVAGVLGGALLGSPAGAAVGAGAVVPYLRVARAGARRGGGRVDVGVAAADLAADLVGLVSMAAGSLRHRSLVI
jgi:glycosyltransferase involved in cell wall biosynthesis